MAREERFQVRVVQDKAAAAMGRRQAVQSLCSKSDNKPLKGFSIGRPW